RLCVLVLVTPKLFLCELSKLKTVARELIQFCSVFGLPRVIQSDQGSNFTSKLFKEVTKELGVEHQLSTAYHPETQGALERFHQTLKSLLRTYCTETGKDWVEGLPFLMFAVRGTVQESLGFSPAELVFGHSVRGPLKLSEQFLARESPRKSALDYVSTVREHLHKAWELARVHLAEAQSKMKLRYDKGSLQRNFQPGD
uniref:Integrase catalytic domain-containing protein n=1 Tax=Cyprinus carpio carpio TaxID=630221 RepID=A0A9J8DIE4_CYPCA